MRITPSNDNQIDSNSIGNNDNDNDNATIDNILNNTEPATKELATIGAGVYCEKVGTHATISTILINIKRQNRLHTIIDKSGVLKKAESFFSLKLKNDKSKLTTVLELAFVSCTKEQLAKLYSSTFMGVSERQLLCDAILNQSMVKMLELEGKQSCSAKKHYRGLAVCVQKYKKGPPHIT